MSQPWRSKRRMLLSLLALPVVHHPGTFFQHQKGIINQSSPFSHGSAMHLSLKIPLRPCKIHHTQQTTKGLRGICVLNAFAWKKMQLQDAMRPRRGLPRFARINRPNSQLKLLQQFEPQPISSKLFKHSELYKFTYTSLHPEQQSLGFASFRSVHSEERHAKAMAMVSRSSSGLRHSTWCSSDEFTGGKQIWRPGYDHITVLGEGQPNSCWLVGMSVERTLS